MICATVEYKIIDVIHSPASASAMVPPYRRSGSGITQLSRAAQSHGSPGSGSKWLECLMINPVISCAGLRPIILAMVRAS